MLLHGHFPVAIRLTYKVQLQMQPVQNSAIYLYSNELTLIDFDGRSASYLPVSCRAVAPQSPKLGLPFQRLSAVDYRTTGSLRYRCPDALKALHHGMMIVIAVIPC